MFECKQLSVALTLIVEYCRERWCVAKFSRVDFCFLSNSLYDALPGKGNNKKCVYFKPCFPLSRWSTLILHRPISAQEPKTWLRGCWNTTPCTDCPSRESCPTLGLLNTQPRSPQPWTMTSPASEPFSCPSTKLLRALDVRVLQNTQAARRCGTSQSACTTTVTANHLMWVNCLPVFWATWFSFMFLSFWLFLSYPWLSIACKYFTVFV